MTQEEKELLLKDLCARLPYEVKIDNIGEPSILASIDNRYTIIVESTEVDKNSSFDLPRLDILKIEDAKPYLFPLSSMTEKQREEWQSLMIRDSYGILYHTIDSFDYLYKNHIDIRGLIPMGSAIDATGLNIY